MVTFEVRGGVQMGVSGHDEMCSIKDRHVADKTTVRWILDAGLQEGSSKFRATLASQT